MLIYHTQYNAEGDERWMADVIDPNRAAFLCTYEGENIHGEIYTAQYAFIFDDDRKSAELSDYIEYFVYVHWGRLISVRDIHPTEEVAADLMFDYRPNHAPVLKEAC